MSKHLLCVLLWSALGLVLPLWLLSRPQPALWMSTEERSISSSRLLPGFDWTQDFVCPGEFPSVLELQLLVQGELAAEERIEVLLEDLESARPLARGSAALSSLRQGWLSIELVALQDQPQDCSGRALRATIRAVSPSSQALHAALWLRPRGMLADGLVEARARGSLGTPSSVPHTSFETRWQASQPQLRALLLFPELLDLRSSAVELEIALASEPDTLLARASSGPQASPLVGGSVCLLLDRPLDARGQQLLARVRAPQGSLWVERGGQPLVQPLYGAASSDPPLLGARGPGFENRAQCDLFWRLWCGPRPAENSSQALLQNLARVLPRLGWREWAGVAAWFAAQLLLTWCCSRLAARPRGPTL